MTAYRTSRRTLCSRTNRRDAAMGLKWMQADSTIYCGGMDLTCDDWVDLNDLAIMCNYWLEGS